ncbi:IS3 family transposase [Paenibacillus roseipurpureus]|uniref:IS3 family transposase n=1 Tax=Paenibacillus roseopurpureus TaxID=2918901 RepID=A0AA96RMJ1_9BACL|nr:IS3 family transposase [Paenibacillus sp. MBLB1832]WNR43686.1 IS3 family transposase [Paenibacillus sp. MBLB1832]WNR46493.1 IS3 family transposase [Paenibacillus sp. MBLB1832]WNR46730.1 IS3 family transposase [Paenibacillus sp. MBLB1832]
MSKKHFNHIEREQLTNNRYVLRVSEKSITYSDEFKRLFIDQYLLKRTPREIFELCGFHVEVLGLKRIEQCADRWKKAYEKDGIIGLADSRKEAVLRPSRRALSPDEIIARQEAKIRLLEAQLEYVKKSDRNERRLLANGENLNQSECFKLIQEAAQQGLGRMTRYFCQLLNVSRSGFYNYLNSADKRQKRALADEQAGALIKKAFNRKGYKKGSRSIKMTLENVYNTCYNLKRIRRLMKKFDLVCPHRKPNPYRLMAKATQEHRTLPNKLQRNFKKGIPGLVLLTDITYLPYGKSQTAYLSTILDASTGELLAHTLSESLHLPLATGTIETLMRQRRLKLHKDAFIHSDQGSHYTSPTYQKLLKTKGIGQSMSRRGNCWDNAPQESFFGHMKDHVKSLNCTTLVELQREVNRYVHYYNHHRYQWGLKKMTPVQYRNHLLSAA